MYAESPECTVVLLVVVVVVSVYQWVKGEEEEGAAQIWLRSLRPVITRSPLLDFPRFYSEEQQHTATI